MQRYDKCFKRPNFFLTFPPIIIMSSFHVSIMHDKMVNLNDANNVFGIKKSKKILSFEKKSLYLHSPNLFEDIYT